VKTRLLTDPCYRPKNITADELPDHPSNPEFDAHYKPYLRFQPTQCRDYSVRQNAAVVFIVSAVEMVIAFYLLYGLTRLGKWLASCVHPEKAWGWIAGEWLYAKQWVLALFPPPFSITAHFLWELLGGVVAVCLIRLSKLMKARL
jgi:hypothetical protein